MFPLLGRFAHRRRWAIILVIAFGPTTDCELFIVSRAREECRRTGDTARSVAVRRGRPAGW
ncbi:hypothetical protein [Nocardiopsis metallicus]|uniref:Putative membrane protein YdfJ with MMPL/SSD domain n=1 Tax=Nocardiopsis metallicus TaxID=179819 RepID=A0A840WEB0_9ACTN|nr:hypothetical protein [Nocardiopsis metallicus]MBB5493753.1 putative membrane protein YdfJ with MMPL/SSD domain [Nocardiopsis metallicus]